MTALIVSTISFATAGFSASKSYRFRTTILNDEADLLETLQDWTSEIWNDEVRPAESPPSSGMKWRLFERERDSILSLKKCERRNREDLLISVDGDGTRMSPAERHG